MMFIAMNRFRVKRDAEGAFEKVWLSLIHISIAFRGSSSSICSKDNSQGGGRITRFPALRLALWH